MNFIVNFLLKRFGFGKAVDALGGATSKAYMGGLGQVLSGGAAALSGVAGLLGQVIKNDAGGAGLIEIAKGIASNPDAGLILAGAALVSKGIADIGQRHAIAKAAPEAPKP